MTHISEEDFVNKIDCSFPYNDKEACLSLINEAAGISTNAMYSVIEEICRMPFSDKGKVSTDFLLELLEKTETMFEHPLKEMVLDTASKMIKGQDLTVDEVISKMKDIKHYIGQHAALSILYFSCDDKEERLESIWNNIISEWNKNAT